MEEYENQKTVNVHGCKDYTSFWKQMSELPDVEKINLYFGTMPDCHDFCRLPKLRELRMCYLKKLSDLHGIEVLGGTLKSLSSSQRSFRTAVFERLDEIKKDLQEQYNQAQ